MKSRNQLLIIFLVLAHLLSAQTLEVQEFVFVGGGTPDYVSADPLLRDRMMDLLTQGLASEIGFEEVTFHDPAGLTYRDSEYNWEGGLESVWNDVRPRRDGDATYFASAISFFKLSSVVTDRDAPWDVEAYHLTFRTKILVLDRESKKVFRKSSSIQAKIYPDCKQLGDTRIRREDFDFLMATGLKDLFSKKKPKRERMVLTCGRSMQLKERLARLDSFEVRRQGNRLNALYAGDIFYDLELTMGSGFITSQQWHFGLDITDEANRKGRLRDLTNDRQYDLVASINADKNFESSGESIAVRNPSVAYFEKDKPIAQFFLTSTGSMKGVWEQDTVVVGYDYDELINYYINGEWVGLSKHLPAPNPQKEDYVDVFFHERSLPSHQREKLIHALLAFEISQAIYSATAGD